MSQTRDQKRFTISEVAADWHELMIRAFILSVRMWVCVHVCQHCNTKTTGRVITKLGRWIVDHNSWSPILFDFERSNVKVSVSLHSSDCQSSSCTV